MSEQEMFDLFFPYIPEFVEGLQLDLNNNRSVKFTSFYEKFKNVADSKAESFKSIEVSFGYGEFFDQCKEKGILN